MRKAVAGWFPWNGSKRWLVPHIEPIVRAYKATRFVEPFVGGGAVSALVRRVLPDMPQVIGDANPWLASAFQAQQEDRTQGICVPRTASAAMKWINAQRALGDADMQGLSVSQRAVRFFVCLFTAWGNRWEARPDGVFRSTVNRRFCMPDYLQQRIAAALAVRWLGDQDTVVAGDWLKTASMSTEGDIVYLDPPYPEALGYGNNVWRFENHLDLIDWAAEHRKSRRVVVSNMGELRRLYDRAGFNTKIVEGPKPSKTRHARTEVIAWS